MLSMIPINKIIYKIILLLTAGLTTIVRVRELKFPEGI